jgi:putative phosphoesterase
VDHIIHAGDLVSLDVICDLEALASVTAVAGNVDSFETYEKLGEKKIVSLGNFNFGIYHGHGVKETTVQRVINKFRDDDVNCIVFGHSHNPYCQYHDGILLFNPGSATDRRRNMYYSVGILDVGKIIKPSIIYFTYGKIIKTDKLYN